MLSTVLVVWVLRKGPELRFHLNAVSTFKVGKVWVFLWESSRPWSSRTC